MAGESPRAADAALPRSPAGELTSARRGAHIWWLEDDRQLCRLLEGRLTACGWHLTLFHRGEALLAALQSDEPDLLILDRLIPGAHGLAVLQSLRQQSHMFPVLMLSALGTPDERIAGLALGANDYLAKPFHSRELLWRIERLLQGTPPARHPRSSRGETMPLGPLTLESARGCLRDATGMEVPLSRGDIALLRMLLDHPGTVRSREQLARGSGSLVDAARSRSLDMRLSRLRRLLRELTAGDVSIEAVRGLGYRLTLPALESDRSEPNPLASILILGVALSLVTLQAVLVVPAQLFWGLGLGGLLILALWQRRLILRLRWQRAELVRQTSEQRAHWQMLLHDQFAPLTRLILRLEDLRPDQPPGQEPLDGLRSDLTLMRQLQEQMQALKGEPDSRADRQRVRLEALCEQIARHYRHDAVRLAVPRLTVRLDVHQLQRVLHNLIDNALEYGSPPVCIRAHPVPGGLVVEVEDRGPALTTVASDLVGGWPHGGLGLALAMEFCGRHGGRLELEPQPGSGLLVRLHLGQDCLPHDAGLGGQAATP